MTDTSRSIQSDEHQTGLGDDGSFDPIDAFRKRFEDAARPSGSEEESTEEPEATGTPEDAETTTEEAPVEAEEVFATDDHKVSVKVGDEEHKVSVKDLKRLFGQEASLTKKSQETAEAFKRAEAEAEKAIVLTDTALKRAHEKFAPYAKIDFALAAQRLDEASYRQLRSDAEAAWGELQFFQQEGSTLLNQVRENRSKMAQEALKKCDEALAADPETKGWDSKARDELVTYVVAQGLPKGVAETLADPAAIKLIRKAMAHDRGVQAVQTKVKPAAKTAPTTSVRPGARDTATPGEAKAKEALNRLRRSGSASDAEAAFKARFAR